MSGVPRSTEMMKLTTMDSGRNLDIRPKQITKPSGMEKIRVSTNRSREAPIPGAICPTTDRM